MELRTAIPTFAAVLYLASFASRVSATCFLTSYTSDACRSANFIKLDLPGGIQINKGSSWWPTSKIIKLPKDMSEIYWYCGSSRERTAWSGIANQLGITYQSDGSIHWSVYKCLRSCTIKDTTYDWCRSSDHIQVEGKKIYKNSLDQVIKLPGLQRQVHWYCGNSRERTAWSPSLKANELSITYSNNGRIKWVIKTCY